jgi:hypothetical protein
VVYAYEKTPELQPRGFSMRFHWLPREKTAIIKLRRLGYTISALTKFTGRSASMIHKVLKFNEAIGAITRGDLRKIPNQLRLRTAQKHRLTIERFMQLWEAFILGETDKPP